MRKKRRVKGRGIIRVKREGGREKKCEERGGTNRKEKRRLEQYDRERCREEETVLRNIEKREEKRME